jgi:hypothetical protein
MIDKFSEFLHQTGSTIDFTYDVENTYLKCSFFEEDIDVMVNLLLDLAVSQKNLFEDNMDTEKDILDINELVRCVAFGKKGIGMPSCGKGDKLSNHEFLNFQRINITPHDTVISMSNVSDSSAAINSIKRKII